MQRPAGEKENSEGTKEEAAVYLVMAELPEEERNNIADKGMVTARKAEIGRLPVRCGSGNGMFRFPGNQEEIRIDNDNYAVSRMSEIRILLHDGWEAAGSFRQEKTGGNKIAPEKRTVPKKRTVPEKRAVPESEKLPESEKVSEIEKLSEVQDLQATGESEFDREDLMLIPDKWEQLKKQYEVMHPFGDEREFISIRPVDFVIMTQQYQKLVHNSFLLHGYFNYRHLILGRDTGPWGDGGICFYLGVPGVFYEREKMVAIMFGFEGFETEGPVEDGKFGYYLRKVEI